MILHPTLEEARALASQGNLCPLYCEVPADLETPVSAYLKVARGQYSFLLESVEGGERLARYSFIGTEPYRTLRSGAGVSGDGACGDPLLAVEEELARFKPVPVPGLPRFTGGAVGYLGYEVVRYFEPRVPRRRERPARPARGGVHVHRHAARLRPPAAQDQGRQPLPARRRHRGGVPAGGLADRGAGRPAREAAGAAALSRTARGAGEHAGS